MEKKEAEVPTRTQREQLVVETRVFQTYDIFAGLPCNAQSLMLELQRDNHLKYLYRGLRYLGPSFRVLDANRPWLCYWILHSIALLGESVDEQLYNDIIDFLSRCQNPEGGYGGGPEQLPHLATTYAAVNSLITLGGEKALSSINRDKLYKFLQQMKHPNGGFRMHDAGEIDVRACYTAISVASILNILDDELLQNVGTFILSCQTYEGGIAGEPGSEAHGGYTFCGLATMILINEVDRLDLPRLLDWLVFRQGRERGFQGRTNKLVDGCYSFWQGGDFALLRRLHPVIVEQLAMLGSRRHRTADNSHSRPASCISVDLEGTSSQVNESSHNRHEDLNVSCQMNFNDIGFNFIKKNPVVEPLFHSLGLQQYIILCSQDQEGGLKDKPDKHRDYYHTCYCLSGLSVCQYSWTEDEENSPPLPREVLGPYSNLLEPIHPLFNVILDRYLGAHDFFRT